LAQEFWKTRTYEFPSKDEGSGVPEEETPVGVFEDILSLFEDWK
jgi:hypothetical protein